MSTKINDFEYQKSFVVRNAWRLINLQDQDQSSPSHGSFHYAYWRDKTSEFPDARYQEAGATLGLLCVDAFKNEIQVEGLDKETLLGAFSDSIKNLSSIQYSNGCFDEWYKGERGFAATEFTTIAFCLAARHLSHLMNTEDLNLLKKIINKSGDWLSLREDKVKANHQAASAAALALAAELTKEDKFRQASQIAINNVLIRQTEEGWFPEIGGMDLGYSSVLLDYTMLYCLVTGDVIPIKNMKKLFDFMLPHIHPDATISPEFGLCLNPYVSRLGIILLSEHHQGAAALISLLEKKSPGQKGLAPYIGDDLRLCRWSHLPLISYITYNNLKKNVSVLNFSSLYPKNWTVNEHSSNASYHKGDLHIYVAVSGGGSVKVFERNRLIYDELSVLGDVSGKAYLTTKGYSLNRSINQTDNGIDFQTSLHPSTYFYPSMTTRLILRIGCIFEWSSKCLRWMIDSYRMKFKSAINQSAAPIFTSAKTIPVQKSVKIFKNKVQISSRITRTNNRNLTLKLNYLTLDHNFEKNLNEKFLYYKIEIPRETKSERSVYKKTIS